jgi:hypothetical protein
MLALRGPTPKSPICGTPYSTVRTLPTGQTTASGWAGGFRRHNLKDHYAALGVGSAATLAEIRKAYRQQAALHHPDRNPAEGAAGRFRAVQEAYDVLSDDDKRTAYDDNRRRNLLDNPLQTASDIWSAYFDRLI